MVNCSIDGCKSRVGRDKVSFYGIPSVLTRQCDLTMELSERRRKIWFERIYRTGFDEVDAPRYVRVCANHFVNGKPSALFDVANADWAPSLNLGKTTFTLTSSKDLLKRPALRRKKEKPDDTGASRQVKNERLHRAGRQVLLTENDERKASFENAPGTSCQTEITCDGFARLEDMYKKVLEENIALRRELETLKSFVRGPLDAEDPLAISDNEGSSTGLEKVEVILKTEPEPDHPEPDPCLEPETSVNTQYMPKEEGIPPVSVCRTPLASENLDDEEQPVNRSWNRGSSSDSEGLPTKRQKVTYAKRSKRYPCSECGQKFISNQALEIHVRIHTGERPFECEVCQKGFSVASTLKAHMRTHTGERPYACQMCPRRFSEHGTLKCHMRTHTGEKPYECDVCHKKFSENSTLRRHLLTHTGERPFECETCHSKFIQKYNLNNHIRRVHTGTILGL